MPRFATHLVRGLCAAVLLAGVAGAAVPDEFTNLKVLPAETGKQELLDIMKKFTADLGMRCSDCHVQKVPGDFDSFDWASDELRNKEKARGMMRMVGRLNGELLPEAAGGHADGITCYTCHRGLHEPRTMEQEMLRTAHKSGIEAAEARYRELREQYYGSGSYDFGSNPLFAVANTMAESDDLDGARAMAKLNIEMNPDDTKAHLQLAQIELAAGNREEAGRVVREVLAKDPENRHAKRMQMELAK
ncbi:c-type cytochrome [bacterium]|nr:c-type cytochrome [bacterium]